MRSRVFLKACLVLFICLIFTASTSALEVKSTAFNEGEVIPLQYTGFGENISPALSWSGVPEGTKSFALIVTDPDAPVGTWVHWIVYNIPEKSTGLPENVSKGPKLADGALQGTNSFKTIGYRGPQPPPGGAHRYIFTLYALDGALYFSPGMNRTEILQEMSSHIIEQTTLMGLYER